MKLYEYLAIAAIDRDHASAKAMAKQILITTWNRDDSTIVFDTISFKSYASSADVLVFTIRFHNTQTNRQFVSVWTIIPTLIGEIKVESLGAPMPLKDWIEKCLVNALCSPTE